MTLYSYFIICNTDDDSDFHIECTSMGNYRLRFSAMKGHFYRRNKICRIKRHTKQIHSMSMCEESQCETSCEPRYFRLFRKNFTFYLLEKVEFEKWEDALKHKKSVIHLRKEKYKNDNVISDDTRECVNKKFVIQF